jgi:hypothetical protein
MLISTCHDPNANTANKKISYTTRQICSTNVKDNDRFEHGKSNNLLKPHNKLSFKAIVVNICPEIKYDKIGDLVNKFVKTSLSKGKHDSEQSIIKAMEETIPGLRASYIKGNIPKDHGDSVLLATAEPVTGLGLQHMYFSPVDNNGTYIIPAAHMLTGVLQNNSNKPNAIALSYYVKENGLEKFIDLEKTWSKFESGMFKVVENGKKMPKDAETWEQVCSDHLVEVFKKLDVPEELGRLAITYVSRTAKEMLGREQALKEAYKTVNKEQPKIKFNMQEHPDWLESVYSNINKSLERWLDVTSNMY